MAVLGGGNFAVVREAPFTSPITSHLDGTGRSSHADEVLPLQDGPEALLQCDDPSQDFLMEEGLKSLTLRLPQEHLHHMRPFTFSFTQLSRAPQKTHKLVSRIRYHGVAHLIPSRQKVDTSEELPDAWLGRARAPGQQHMKVAHKVLQHDACAWCETQV